MKLLETLQEAQGLVAGVKAKGEALVALEAALARLDAIVEMLLVIRGRRAAERFGSRENPYSCRAGSFKGWLIGSR